MNLFVPCFSPGEAHLIMQITQTHDRAPPDQVHILLAHDAYLTLLKQSSMWNLADLTQVREGLHSEKSPFTYAVWESSYQNTCLLNLILAFWCFFFPVSFAQFCCITNNHQ